LRQGFRDSDPPPTPTPSSPLHHLCLPDTTYLKCPRYPKRHSPFSSSMLPAGHRRALPPSLLVSAGLLVISRDLRIACAGFCSAAKVLGRKSFRICPFNRGWCPLHTPSPLCSTNPVRVVRLRMAGLRKPGPVVQVLSHSPLSFLDRLL